MNKLKCFLTGGHRYSDANTISVTNEGEDVYVFYNYCLKCGKPYTVKVDISRENAINALDRIFNFCEEIDNHLPDTEKTGYKMLSDYLIIMKYLNNQ